MNEDDHVVRYLERYKNLPGGCEIYQITRAGNIWKTGNGTIDRISSDNPTFANMLHLFINQGNQAMYLLGNPKTDKDHPENATVKLGLMKPHHHFEPHKHGVQHFVLSAGYTGCALYDEKTKSVVSVELQPFSMIDIKPHVPHAFVNRDEKKPANILVVNAGLGIENSEYAVTEAQAQARIEQLEDSPQKQELIALIAALHALKEDLNQRKPAMHIQEKIGDFFAAVGERMSMLTQNDKEQQKAWDSLDNAGLTKYVTGTATEEERERIEKLAAENPDVRKLIDLMQSVIPGNWRMRTSGREGRIPGE